MHLLRMTSPSDHPEPVLQSLADGAIRIQVGAIAGTVHSDHLVPQKLNQVVAAWRRAHIHRLSPEFLAALRRQYRAELVLVLVQLEQVCPGWWIDLAQLAEQLGSDRATLNRSIRKLEQLGMVRKHSISNLGGTWIWWVKRHADDRPRPEDEPAWLLRRVCNGKLERIPISQRREWARLNGVTMPSLCNLLYGHIKVLDKRWALASTPMDGFAKDCHEAAGLPQGSR